MFPTKDPGLHGRGDSDAVVAAAEKVQGSWLRFSPVWMRGGGDGGIAVIRGGQKRRFLKCADVGARAGDGRAEGVGDGQAGYGGGNFSWNAYADADRYAFERAF